MKSYKFVRCFKFLKCICRGWVFFLIFIKIYADKCSTRMAAYKWFACIFACVPYGYMPLKVRRGHQMS